MKSNDQEMFKIKASLEPKMNKGSFSRQEAPLIPIHGMIKQTISQPKDISRQLSVPQDPPDFSISPLKLQKIEMVQVIEPTLPKNANNRPNINFENFNK